MEPLTKSKSRIYEIIDSMQINPLTASVAKSIVAMGGNPTKFLVEAISHDETVKAELKHPKPALPADYTETERLIHEMLIENTGAHILDSGSVYGRAWERNRRVTDFHKLPIIHVEVGKNSLELLQLNIFHYLRFFLERDKISKSLEKEFYEIAENKTDSWLTLMMDFTHHLTERGWEYDGAWNSYNWENLLSQVIQGVSIISPDGELYIMLQIHNGCDVRGGYTKPRFFRLVEEDEGDFFAWMSEISAYCNCYELHSDDSGYNWHIYDRKTETDIGLGNLPKDWKPHKSNLRCRRCRKTVAFYHRIMDYL